MSSLTAPLFDDDDVVVEATVDLDATEARALTDRIRGLVVEAVALLRQAYDGRVWIALGYTSWPAYLAGELGGALAGLPTEQRHEAIGVLADSGMSRRAIGAAVGRSDERVRAALKLVRPDGVSAPSVGMDGKTYVRSATAAQQGAQALVAARPQLALPGPRKTKTTLELLEQAGPDGSTIPELARRKRWTYSEAGATLSRLNASRDRDGLRRCERLAERRGGHSPYVLPWHVGAREILQPGQRLPRA